MSGDFYAFAKSSIRYSSETFKVLSGIGPLERSSLKLEWLLCNLVQEILEIGKSNEDIYLVFENQESFISFEKMINRLFEGIQFSKEKVETAALLINSEGHSEMNSLKKNIHFCPKWSLTLFCQHMHARSQTHTRSHFTIESDWSSASYWYSIMALSEIGTEITLSSYKPNSLQGDSALVEIYSAFGVETIFENNSILLRKTHNPKLTTHNLQLNNCPDIAQTIAVTCFGLGLPCHLTGLHTLKIKETDRLEALKTELTKLGAKVTVTHESLTLEQSESINPNINIKTYQDHRMAMAFAPLAIKVPIVIEEAEVVSKSYPTFWADLKLAGFSVAEQ